MKSIFTGTTSQKSINEDFSGYSARAGWVLDGATGSANLLKKSKSDAQWFVGRISMYLTELTGRHQTRLRDDIFLAVSRTSADFQEELQALGIDGHSPSATIAAFKADIDNVDNQLEICLVGDCNASVRVGGSWDVYSDDRIKKLELPLATAIFEYITSGRGNVFQAREHYSDWFQENRDKRNIDYAVACEALVPDDILSFDMCLQGETQIVLSTDGAYRLVDVFERFTPVDYADFAVQQGVNALLEASVNKEDTDPHVKIYPRTKPWDDATILIAEL